MSESTEAAELLVSFPAAGAGGATLEQVEKLALRRGMAYLAASNPESVEALDSGQWQERSTEEIRRAADQASAGRVLLFGHCMGGLSAISLADGLGARLDLPVTLLVVNTPCPDSAGRIPTMSRFSDAEIAHVLAQDGFPRELLDDEDLLPEIAEGLREDAVVADRLAERLGAAGGIEDLHLLSTRGDAFIPPETCVGWRDRVAREFHLTITPGGHTIDETLAGVLERAVESAAARDSATAVDSATALDSATAFAKAPPV
jgi:surfactin synthase thioesterase subunit